VPVYDNGDANIGLKLVRYLDPSGTITKSLWAPKVLYQSDPNPTDPAATSFTIQFTDNTIQSFQGFYNNHQKKKKKKKSITLKTALSCGGRAQRIRFLDRNGRDRRSRSCILWHPFCAHLFCLSSGTDFFHYYLIYAILTRSIQLGIKKNSTTNGTGIGSRVNSSSNINAAGHGGRVNSSNNINTGDTEVIVAANETSALIASSSSSGYQGNRIVGGGGISLEY